MVRQAYGNLKQLYSMDQAQNELTEKNKGVEWPKATREHLRGAGGAPSPLGDACGEELKIVFNF